MFTLGDKKIRDKNSSCALLVSAQCVNHALREYNLQFKSFLLNNTLLLSL